MPIPLLRMGIYTRTGRHGSSTVDSRWTVESSSIDMQSCAICGHCTWEFLCITMNFRIADMTIALLGRLCKDWLLCVKRVMCSECRSSVDGWTQSLNPLVCTRLYIFFLEGGGTHGNSNQSPWHFSRHWGSSSYIKFNPVQSIWSSHGEEPHGVTLISPDLPAFIGNPRGNHWVHTTWWAQGPSQCRPQSNRKSAPIWTDAFAVY